MTPMPNEVSASHFPTTTTSTTAAAATLFTNWNSSGGPQADGLPAHGADGDEQSAHFMQSLLLLDDPLVNASYTEYGAACLASSATWPSHTGTSAVD